MPALVGIFLTVFLDMMSFGLVIPDIQDRADQLGAQGIVRGLLIAIFSIAQFFVAPYLGRLSDSVGRRRILIISTLIAALGHAVYAHASILWIMFLSRILGGMASANLSVAYAYVADVTTPENRSKGMGMVGAAFGLGFLFGPSIGAKLLEIGNDDPLIMGYTAAVLSLINWVYIWLFLPETVSGEGAPPKRERMATLNNLLIGFRTPGLWLLLALFFMVNLAFANLESTYFLLVLGPFGLQKIHGAYLLATVGVVSIVAQTVLIRLLTPKLGEVRLVRIGYFMMVPCLLLVPFAPPWLWQIVGIVFLGTASGLSQPSMSSLISRSTPPDMQGGIFGVTQSLGSMARIAGPLIGNALYDVRYWAPYACAAGLMLLPALGAWKIREPEPSSPGPIPTPEH